MNLGSIKYWCEPQMCKILLPYILSLSIWAWQSYNCIYAHGICNNSFYPMSADFSESYNLLDSALIQVSKSKELIENRFLESDVMNPYYLHITELGIFMKYLKLLF